MTTTTPTVDRDDAARVLARVRHRYRDYIEQGISPEPELVENYSFVGPPVPYAVVWEEGPDDWAHRATAGGTAESDRVLLAEAAREFGLDPASVSVRPDTPIRVPSRVTVEPVVSFVLGIWPA